MDINNLGDVAFMAGLNGTQAGVDDGEPAGIFFWDRVTNTVCQVQRLGAGFFGFFTEVITTNNAKSVLFGTKNSVDTPGINDVDIQEEGLYLWTAGTITPLIRIGDTLDGSPVTAVFAQHQSFEYQLNEVCGVASAAFVNNNDPDDAQETPCQRQALRLVPRGLRSRGVRRRRAHADVHPHGPPADCDDDTDRRPGAGCADALPADDDPPRPRDWPAWPSWCCARSDRSSADNEESPAPAGLSFSPVIFRRGITP